MAFFFRSAFSYFYFLKRLDSAEKRFNFCGGEMVTTVKWVPTNPSYIHPTNSCDTPGSLHRISYVQRANSPREWLHAYSISRRYLSFPNFLNSSFHPSYVAGWPYRHVALGSPSVGWALPCPRYYKCKSRFTDYLIHLHKSFAWLRLRYTALGNSEPSLSVPTRFSKRPDVLGFNNVFFLVTLFFVTPSFSIWYVFSEALQGR